MPNNDNDLRNRLAVLENQLGLRNNNDIARNNNNTDIQGDLFGSTGNLNRTGTCHTINTTGYL